MAEHHRIFQVVVRKDHKIELSKVVTMQSCLMDELLAQPKELDQSLLGFINRHPIRPLAHEGMSQNWEWRQPPAANSDILLENLDELLKAIEPEVNVSNNPDFSAVSCFPSELEPTPIKPGLFLHQEDEVIGLVRSQQDRTMKKRKPTPVTDARPHKQAKKMGKHPKFRPHQHHQFQMRYETLLRFKEQHGHCLVPHNYPEDPGLARWVKRQRYQYKMKAAGNIESTMTEERISMLEAVGFVWDSHKLAWEDHLEELKLYKQKHGDCNVPSTLALGAWVKFQRRQYRRLFNGESYNITFERIAALDALGFDWKMRNEVV